MPQIRASKIFVHSGATHNFFLFRPFFFFFAKLVRVIFIFLPSINFFTAFTRVLLFSLEKKKKKNSNFYWQQ